MPEDKRRDRAIANITFCEMYKGSTGYKPSRQFTILLVGKMDKEGKHKQIRKKRKRKRFERYNLFPT